MDLPVIVLDRGGHTPRENKVCLMEAVALLAGENHTDKPVCACPILNYLGQCLNDYAPTKEDRHGLIEFAYRLVGSVAVEHEKTRKQMIRQFVEDRNYMMPLLFQSNTDYGFAAISWSIKFLPKDLSFIIDDTEFELPKKYVKRFRPRWLEVRQLFDDLLTLTDIPDPGAEMLRQRAATIRPDLVNV